MSRSGGFETTEFRRSFSMETDRLLRRRLAWFVAVWGGLGLVGIAALIGLALLTQDDLVLKILFGAAGGWRRAVLPLGLLAWVVAYGTALFLVLIRREISDTVVVRLSLMLIVFDGVYGLSGRIGMVEWSGLWYFWLAHLVACLVFPWTARQALIPITVVLSLSFLSRFVGIESMGTGLNIFLTLMFFSAMMPAVLICGVRHSKRVQEATNRFLHQRYGVLRQELAYARRVHEGLFPQPKGDGAVRFSYKYEPMRQIGGDYLYANTRATGAGEVISAVLLDVTGHGIPAALTVNRLHGEIDLRFAERPDLGPGELLWVLNRYIGLTLAKHSIFATAVCLRVDSEAGTIRYASAGHPPAFIRGIDGTLRELDPTSFLLGVCSDTDFDPGERCEPFHEGDTLIAYTDGAIEARSATGKMFGINGLRRLLAEPGRTGPGGTGPVGNGPVGNGLGGWSERILAEVARHRGGLAPEDDTLAIEIHRAVGALTPLNPRPEPAAGVSP